MYGGLINIGDVFMVVIMIYVVWVGEFLISLV